MILAKITRLVADALSFMLHIIILRVHFSTYINTRPSYLLHTCMRLLAWIHSHAYIIAFLQSYE